MIPKSRGKTPGTDLREGVLTLPVLYACRTTDADSGRLRELLAAPLTDDALHAEALKLLRSHPAIEQARSHTERLAQQATDLIATLPSSDARDALQALPLAVAGYLLTRYPGPKTGVGQISVGVQWVVRCPSVKNGCHATNTRRSFFGE